MSNSTKVIEENIDNKNFGFESALFIPAKEKFENNQEEKFEDFSDLFIFRSKFESSNNLESNEAQKRNSLGNLNIHSLLSQDLMRKIEDCSPMKSAEGQKFGFMELKISSKVLFNKSEAQNFNSNEEQNLNFIEDALQGKFNKENIQKFNSCFVQNPFFSKASEESKNAELANLINETEKINYDKFDSIEFQNFNSIHKEENLKNINEELLFSKLLESLNINNESSLEASDIMISPDLERDGDLNVNLNNNTKKGSDLNSNFNNENNLGKKIIGDFDNNGQLTSTLLQNININNNFNYNIGNNLPHLHYYNYLMSLNPYLLNASLVFKLNYLQKLQNYLININKNNKIKTSNYQYGKAGWTCLYCNNFNYEIRIKCNRCGKVPQNKKDAKTREDVNAANNDDASFMNKKTNLFTGEKKRFGDKNLFFQTTINKNNFDNKSAQDTLSNINVNTKAFIPSSFKDTNIHNSLSKSTNMFGSESKVFNYPTYPNLNQNYNIRSLINNNNSTDSFCAAQNNLQVKSDKINKFNAKTDCSKDESVTNKEKRVVFNHNNLNSKMIEFSKKNVCTVDKGKLYYNGFMQNQNQYQYLYNHNTPINKFNTCNSTYSNPLKNEEMETSYLNNEKSSSIESLRADQIDNNKFNLSENPAAQLNPKVNSTSNPIDFQADKKKKKPFVERIGDWVCLKCKNLNFSFRLSCNRCQLPKVENEKLSESTGKKSL